MRRTLSMLLATSVLSTIADAQIPAADAAAWAAHQKTRVLYAGWVDGSRQKVFEAFLKQWFDQVGVIDLEKLTVATARDFDVVIADWGSQYGNDGYPKRDGSLFTPNVELGVGFTKPVIAMNFVSSSLRSRHKLDWL